MQIKNTSLSHLPNFLLSLSFSLSIFFGAFLLFQVQPIISKDILPWFGGASAVWITALLFFQTLLLAGYLYVFLISKLSLRKQMFLHSIFLALITAPVLFSLLHARIAVLPDIKQKLPDTVSPVLQILQILFIATGLPYLLLSTTSILLQKWYEVTNHGKSPYLFYALSNAASLLALISYPFFVEPNYTLNTQGLLWSIGFMGYGIFLLFACLMTFLQKNRKTHGAPERTQMVYGTSVRVFRKNFLWILLPALSSLMLLAITNLLTQSVASVPFLWLLPLCLYLLSFILCFSGRRWYWRNFYAYVFLASGFLALIFTRTDIPSLFSGILIYALTLFSACMLCHGELYRLRPHPEKLDLYYLCIAGGSAISGVFVGIIAPVLFKGIWEIYIGFYSTFLLCITVLVYYKRSFVYRYLSFFGSSVKEAYIAAALCFPFVILGVSLFLNMTSHYTSVKVWRNFYGILIVSRKTVNNLSVTYLKHGNIIHGDQFSGIYRREPTTYFSKQSGIGLVLTHLEKQHQRLHIGIIGLGAGTLAAYGRKGDAMTFYELNPQVVQIANEEFTYLKDSPAKLTVVTGDGRLSLEKELRQPHPALFDLLVVDAFSDDAIPLHLLTKEAFIDYQKRLVSPNGILAFHISNNYIDLKPVLVRMAKEFHLSATFIHTHRSGIATEAEWAFLTKDTTAFTTPAITRYTESNNGYKQVALWTDNYSNLFQILK